MNQKEIAQELIVKMTNAVDRKESELVREYFADVVFVGHASLNGMHGVFVSADEFVASWRQLLRGARRSQLLSNFELLPSTEGIRAECHAHILYTAVGI